jgi:hypothetical protein
MVAQYDLSGRHAPLVVKSSRAAGRHSVGFGQNKDDDADKPAKIELDEEG